MPNRYDSFALEEANSLARNSQIISQMDTHSGKFEMARKITRMETQIEATHELADELFKKAEIIEQGQTKQVRFYALLWAGALITSVCALILNKIY